MTFFYICLDPPPFPTIYICTLRITNVCLQFIFCKYSFESIVFCLRWWPFFFFFKVLFNLANVYFANEMYTEALNTYNIIVKNKLFNSAGGWTISAPCYVILTVAFFGWNLILTHCGCSSFAIPLRLF